MALNALLESICTSSNVGQADDVALECHGVSFLLGGVGGGVPAGQGCQLRGICAVDALGVPDRDAGILERVGGFGFGAAFAGGLGLLHGGVGVVQLLGGDFPVVMHEDG